MHVLTSMLSEIHTETYSKQLHYITWSLGPQDKENAPIASEHKRGNKTRGEIWLTLMHVNQKEAHSTYRQIGWLKAKFVAYTKQANTEMIQIHP